jgi:hypothetical protein
MLAATLAGTQIRTYPAGTFYRPPPIYGGKCCNWCCSRANSDPELGRAFTTSVTRLRTAVEAPRCCAQKITSLVLPMPFPRIERDVALAAIPCSLIIRPKSLRYGAAFPCTSFTFRAVARLSRGPRY